jgi:hypothetical protein
MLVETIKPEVIGMEINFAKFANSANSAKGLEYANLQEGQEKRLREIEMQFNNEFGTDYYLMVLKKD